MRLEAFIAERLHFGFARVDGRDDGLQFLDVALVLGADEPSDDAVEYLGCFHLGYRRFLTVFCALVCTGEHNAASANILL